MREEIHQFCILYHAFYDSESLSQLRNFTEQRAMCRKHRAANLK